MQWATFLEAHWGAVCAADFFTVEVLTPLGLSRRHVLFVMDLETRVVEIAGIVAEPYTERPHQGRENRLLRPEVAANGPGPIQRRRRLGGVLDFYSRAA